MPYATNILSSILTRLSRLTIWRFRPGIIGVTGSVGKTSTKLAIAAVTGGERDVRWAKGNMNTALGIPLTILGDWSESDLRLVTRETPPGERRLEKALFFFKVIVLSLFRFLFSSRAKYPEILILEYGADRPGDLKILLAIARPNVSIITAVGDIPSHVEFYSSPEEVAREKARLIECLPSAGFAILNADDKSVMRIADRTRANVMTFGFGEDSDVRITAFEYRFTDGSSANGGSASGVKGEEIARPTGISFKLEYGGSFVPVRLNGVLGKSHAYAAAASACVGLMFGFNLVKISDSLEKYVPAHRRMELVWGMNDVLLIDDSYNASPLSVSFALEALKDLPGKRKVAVLGDMLELGVHTEEGHRRVGTVAAKCADVLITVGARAKFIAEAAKAAGSKKLMIKCFDTIEEATNALREMVKKGDVVLVKASRGMGLDAIVEELRKEEISE